MPFLSQVLRALFLSQAPREQFLSRALREPFLSQAPLALFQLQAPFRWQAPWWLQVPGSLPARSRQAARPLHYLSQGRPHRGYRSTTGQQ